MKKKVMFWAMMSCLFVAIVSLTGCGNENEDKDVAGPAAVCYAIAPTANAQGLNLNSPLVQDMAYDTILGYGYISVVTIDGNPELVNATSYDIPEQYKNASKEKLKVDARSNATNLIAFMENEVANDPQVDYLEGLRLAARSLNSLEGYESKTICMIGTGLSSKGTLNFKNNLLSANVESILDLLEEKNEIPNLEGFTVVFQQIGDTAAPQQALSQTQRIRLQEIWGGIVERGGGTFVYNDIMPNPVKEDISFPEVDTIELPKETPIKFDKELIDSNEDLFEEPIVITEEQVTFVPDQAAYLNEEEASKTIQPIAEYLIENDEVTILLAGTTAGDENSENAIKLSQDRADTVRDTLINLGVDQSRIVTKGTGSDNPWHVSGEGYEGAIAAANRSVVLLDANSETAKEILNK